MYDANKKVIVYHQPSTSDGEFSECNRIKYVINDQYYCAVNTLGFIKVKAGKGYAITYPLKSMVYETIESKEQKGRKEFTYLRLYDVNSVIN